MTRKFKLGETISVLHNNTFFDGEVISIDYKEKSITVLYKDSSEDILYLDNV